jgi:tetratricopeptide (TPR) repeat protein
LFFWLLVSGGPLGFDPVTFTGPFLTFLSFGQFLVPLLGLEIYLRVQNSAWLAPRIAVACGLLVVTLAMVVGTGAIAAGLWLPRAKAGLDSRTSIAGVLLVTINSSGLDAALTQYRQLKAQHPKDYNFDEKELNTLGYQLIRSNQFAEAERVLQLNVDAYPQSGNTYDSLAEAYLDDGKRSEAFANYRRSLELNPDNQGAAKAIAKLASH